MQEHERWLSIAELDLKSARSLLRDELFSMATFHCQQAAEKALKGYLAFRNQEIVRSHDLIKLGDLCKKLDKEFERLADTLEKLNPFATKFRYPSAFDTPDDRKTMLIIEQTKSVLIFVTEKISAQLTGQLKIQ